MHIPGNSAAPEEEKKFPVIPPGSYTVKVLDVKVKQSAKVGEFWSLQLEIQGGKYEGQMLWDSLFFTPKGLNRFFLVWKRLTGCELDRSADLDVLPDDLFGCKAVVEVENVEEEWKGAKFTKAKIPYGGYADFGSDSTEPEEEDDIPDFK